MCAHTHAAHMPTCTCLHTHTHTQASEQETSRAQENVLREWEKSQLGGQQGQCEEQNPGKSYLLAKTYTDQRMQEITCIEKKKIQSHE